MNMNINKNIAISGIGKLNCGDYNEISISGSGDILESVEATKLEIVGTATINGDARIKEILITGNLFVEGCVIGEGLKTSGATIVNKMIELTTLETNGSFTCHDVINSKYISCNGTINSVRIDTSKFLSSGSINVKEQINASEIDITLFDNSFVKELKGDKVHIKKCNKKKSTNNIFKLFKPKFKLTVELIESNHISIEFTNADKIRGKNVIIGPNSKVQHVEYSDFLEIDPTSQVINSKKV